MASRHSHTDDANDTSLEILGPPPESEFYGYYRKDWIDLCEDIKHSDRAVYGVLRSLVYEARGLRNDKVFRVSLIEMCELIPGVKGKPLSLTSLRDSLRNLSTVGLVSDPDGKPLTTSSGKRAAGRPIRMRIHDLPCNGYKPRWSNTEQKLEAIRAKTGQKTDQGSEAGQKTDQPGQKTDHDIRADQEKCEPDYCSCSSSHHTLTPAPSSTNGGEVETDGVCVSNASKNQPPVDADRVEAGMAAARRGIATGARGKLTGSQFRRAQTAVKQAIARGCTLKQITQAVRDEHTDDRTTHPGSAVERALEALEPVSEGESVPEGSHRDREAYEAAAANLARRMPAQITPSIQADAPSVTPVDKPHVVERRPGRPWQELVAQHKD